MDEDGTHRLIFERDRQRENLEAEKRQFIQHSKRVFEQIIVADLI